MSHLPEYRPDWLTRVQKYFPGAITRIEIPKVHKYDDGVLVDEEALAENQAEHLELEDDN